MIKRLNKSIISFFWSMRLRPTVATVLGGFAGLSLTATILPTAIAAMGITDDFSARMDLAGFALYSVMWWALGGWSAQRSGNTWAGALALGLVGATSGAFFTAMTYGLNSQALPVGAAAGLAYGVVGGMLIATALAEHKKNGADAAN